MNAPRVRIDLAPLQKMRRQIRASRAVDEMYFDWGRRYLAFLRDQFRRNRAGGGDWPPLKPETLERTPKRIGILHVTGVLFNALRPGQPGNVLQRVRTGIAAGVGGTAKHPGTDLTIADLVKIHNAGAGNVPKRQIIYPPDRTLTAYFQQAARRMVERLIRENARR